MDPKRESPQPKGADAKAVAVFGPEEFLKATGASRATLAKLVIFARMLEEWQERINLVSNASLADLWRRHFLDSAQLAPLIGAQARSLVDIGSGAGFPGLVLAIVSKQTNPDFHVQLIEATQKKARFLEAVAGATGVAVTIHNARAEDLKGVKADIITARALAPLDPLFGMAAPFFQRGSAGLFLKGQGLSDELIVARRRWNFDIEEIESQSDSTGRIARVTGLQRCPTFQKPSLSAKKGS